MSKPKLGDTKDEIVAAALASGKTHREAGEAAGVSERTVRRRLEQPEFRTRVSEQRTELVGFVADRLAGLAPEAVETMYSLMSEDNPPGVRCKAALAILSSSRVWRDASEVEARLQMLEDLAAPASGQESA